MVVLPWDLALLNGFLVKWVLRLQFCLGIWSPLNVFFDHCDGGRVALGFGPR